MLVPTCDEPRMRAVIVPRSISRPQETRRRANARRCAAGRLPRRVGRLIRRKAVHDRESLLACKTAQLRGCEISTLELVCGHAWPQARSDPAADRGNRPGTLTGAAAGAADARAGPPGLLELCERRGHADLERARLFDTKGDFTVGRACWPTKPLDVEHIHGWTGSIYGQLVGVDGFKLRHHQEDCSGHHTGECALPRHHASALPVVVSSPTDSTVCGVQLRNHLDLSYLGDGSRTPRSDSCWGDACALSREHHTTSCRDTDIISTGIPLPCVLPLPVEACPDEGHDMDRSFVVSLSDPAGDFSLIATAGSGQHDGCGWSCTPGYESRCARSRTSGSAKIDHGVMTAYPTITLLFNVLSCVAGSKLCSWSDVWKLDPAARISCYRFVIADLLKWPERLVGCGRPLATPLRISSAFSGTGMAERCGDLLGQALGQRLTSSCLWIEKADGPALLLARLCPGARGVRDILELLPTTTAALHSNGMPSFDDLKRAIIDDEPDIDVTVLGGSAGRSPRGLLGDVHIAGPPCTDFSMMGSRKCTAGSTMILFLAWVRMLLVVLPPVVVFENVKLFPMDLLHTLLGVAYRIDEVITDPCKLGWPIRRVRRYAVLIARSHNCSWRPLAELFDNLKVDRPLPGRVLFSSVTNVRRLCRPVLLVIWKRIGTDMGATLLTYSTFRKMPGEGRGLR